MYYPGYTGKCADHWDSFPGLRESVHVMSAILSFFLIKNENLLSNTQVTPVLSV